MVRRTKTIRSARTPSTTNWGLPAVKIVGKGIRKDGIDFYIIDIVIRHNEKVFNLGGDLRSHDQKKD